MIDPNKDNIERFCNSVAEWEEAYKHAGLSFFAVRRGNALHLLQGRIFLHTVPANIPARLIQSENVVVGYFLLSDLGLDFHGVLAKILASEVIPTPIGPLILPVDVNAQPSSHFMPFHPEGINSGNRLAVLLISGMQRHAYLQQPAIDWELKASSTPYDTLNELLIEYSLGTYRGDFAHIEIIASNVVAVDFNSKVSGELAEPAIFLANGLDRIQSCIGYRVVLHGQVVERGSLVGETLTWEESNLHQRGVGRVVIPAGAVLQCFATYHGTTHHQGWIADPSLSQNPVRASFEEFDEKLEVLRDFLFEEKKPRKDSRDFEVGVAWLLSMLGFSVVHAGATSRTSDATDIMALTRNGNIALVECTVGHLKADTKLSKLIERAQTVRKRLDASGNRHLKLLPVIVTALGRDEVKADLEQARKLGVVVTAREDLEIAMQRTITIQDAEQLFVQAEESLRNMQEELDLGFSET